GSARRSAADRPGPRSTWRSARPTRAAPRASVRLAGSWFGWYSSCQSFQPALKSMKPQSRVSRVGEARRQRPDPGQRGVEDDVGEARNFVAHAFVLMADLSRRSAAGARLA